MKKQFIIAIVILIMAGFACSIQNIQMETVETRVVNVAEALPGNTNETELIFKMTGGQFTINPGSDQLANGSIVYNVEHYEPEFTRRDNYLEIKQVEPFRFTGLPIGDVENIWNLEITEVLPLDLRIEGGASENIFNFSGLQLTRLSIIQGGSDTTIRFEVPNPVPMDEFSFTTGASSARLYGLANAGFRRMSMSAGAGNYTLDFGGILSQDTVVDIKAGVSNITLIIPAEMRAVVNTQGTVTNINTRGTWLVSNDQYSTLMEGNTLLINLDMAIGNITLVHEE